jgi:hypothetical protein
LRSTASSATTAAVSNVNSSVSSSLSPLARQSPAGLRLWCGGARPDPLYCVGSSRCPLVIRLDRRPVCTATGGVGFGGGGATGSGRRCRCGSRRSTRSGHTQKLSWGPELAHSTRNKKWDISGGPPCGRDKK